MDLTFLKNFNNYFNRQIKYYANYSNYTNLYAYKVISNNVDFDPADGVNTNQIVNWSEDYTPDYLLVTKQVINNNITTTEIVSRWFVTEWKRIRGKQYNATLKRDVIADNYDLVIAAPCFIEKGTVTNKTNSLLYNKEGMTFNQIKDEDEILLPDQTGSAWIVGYMASNLLGEGEEPISETTKDVPFKDITLTSAGSNAGSAIFPVSNEVVLSECYFIVDGAIKKHGTEGVSFTFSTATGLVTWTINLGAEFANKHGEIRIVFSKDAYVESKNYKMAVPGGAHRNHLEDAPYDMFCIPYGSVHLRSANIDTEGAASWQIAMELTKDLGSANIYDVQLLPYCPALNMLASGDVAEVLGTKDYDFEYIIDKNSFDTKSICIWCKKSTGSFDFIKNIEVPREREEISSELTFTERRCTVISRNPTVIRLSDTSLEGKTLSEIPSLTITVGVEGVTEVQTETITSGITFTRVDNSQIDITYPNSSLTISGTGKLTTTIKYISGYIYENPEYLDYKISNETDVYRLVSPNYNGQFEFSLAKNAGISGFNIDFTYKPFQPYVHITPWLKNLYGADTDDARGLICGGDFSLPQISSAWTDFQVQNKNYQAMFNRDIENMDVNNYWQSSMQALDVGLGGLNSAASMGGAVAKGGAMGGFSAGAKGLTGLVGGIYDLNAQGEIREENRDFAIDKFNMQLGNIQAMPWSLTKVSAYNANNKLFPFIERYHCTDIEKNALKNKITYEGMTVMVISTINTFLPFPTVDTLFKRYIKGKIIRIDNLIEDSHMANAIYDEINKGVYF